MADPTVVVAIIGIFGTILAVALYFYLFRKNGSKAKSSSPLQSSTNSADEILRKEAITKLGEDVLQLLNEVEQVKDRINGLQKYLEQKVEIWKQKIQPAKPRKE